MFAYTLKMAKSEKVQTYLLKTLAEDKNQCRKNETPLIAPRVHTKKIQRANKASKLPRLKYIYIQRWTTEMNRQFNIPISDDDTWRTV